MRLSRVTFVTALLLLVIAPSAALACSIAIETVHPQIQRTDLRVMHRHTSTRGAWVQDQAWKSYGVSLVQRVQLDGMSEPVTAAYRQQRSVQILASHPLVSRYYDDEDPATTCELAGKQTWTTPKVLVHETSRAVFITLVMKQTQGSTSGCLVASTSCDDSTFRTIALAAPIGTRQLYSTTFA